MVHIKNEMLGNVIKEARQRSRLTMEEIADRVGITPRYLYRIENEGKKPSFDILYALIRELSISPDLIFYPEKPKKIPKWKALSVSYIVVTNILLK